MTAKMKVKGVRKVSNVQFGILNVIKQSDGGEDFWSGLEPSINSDQCSMGCGTGD
jgi:hypothetical protein